MPTGNELAVLEYLKTHRYITVLQCIKHLHTTELRKYQASAYNRTAEVHLTASAEGLQDRGRVEEEQVR